MILLIANLSDSIVNYVFYVCLKSWVSIGIWSRYRYSVFSSVFFMSVRYSVFWNTSVFGIGISEILVENRKFLVPHFYLAPPVEGDPVGISQSGPLWKTRMMGHQAIKSLIVSLAVSIHQREKQTDRRTPHDSKDRAKDCVAPVFKSLCCFNCLFLLYSTHKRLFGLIHRRKRLKN